MSINETVEPVTEEEWDEHTVQTLENVLNDVDQYCQPEDIY